MRRGAVIRATPCESTLVALWSHSLGVTKTSTAHVQAPASQPPVRLTRTPAEIRRCSESLSRPQIVLVIPSLFAESVAQVAKRTPCCTGPSSLRNHPASTTRPACSTSVSSAVSRSPISGLPSNLAGVF